MQLNPRLYGASNESIHTEVQQCSRLWDLRIWKL
jgi:hypothetical protein